jgi:S-formylglutathione hydrolase
VNFDICIGLRRLPAATLFVLLMTGVSGIAAADQPAQVQAGRVVNETLHGASLQGNVTGEMTDRPVIVYLPPSYDSSPAKRYPVIYLLHGIGGTGQEFIRNPGAWNSVPSVMDQGTAARLFKEMIVVMPNQFTKRFGSYYTNSTVTGRWEDFTVRDLVSFIDKKYRTLAAAGSRGIAGHSMGGYGALRIGMKNPDTFSVVYGLNPALPGWSADITVQSPAYRIAARAKTYEDIPAPPNAAAGVITVSQAFSPNPDKPPFFLNLPFAEVDGRMVPSEPGFSDWEKNFLHNMVRQHREQLLRLRGYRFDSADNDSFQFISPNSRELSQVLTTNGIDHVFEEYNGDHFNRIYGPLGRFATEVFPYFSRLLDSDKKSAAGARKTR